MLRITLKYCLALTLFITAGLALPAGAWAESAQAVVKLQTTMGDIDIALNQDKAPETVKNFLT